ncbi:unnamed protein product [Rangifer tarandus platyrhynchus]|uniref:Uncharacterized protein n=2 Tax=Rangifer tarandus platyrhynchus TaxID=3082113 RepID=A0ABN8YJD4_RANTA|nr:unnamed protein product [Rangifer tarandus platyrhynchus]
MLLRGDSSAAPSERVPTSPGGSGHACPVSQWPEGVTHCGCGEEGLWSLEPPRHLQKQGRFPALLESCPVEGGDTTYFSVLPPPPQPTPLHSASPESHIQFPEWAMIV